MLALYRAGRQADALEAYRAARSALVERARHRARPASCASSTQAILEQDPALDLPAAPVAARRRQGAAFVGRGRELAELVGGLDDAFAGRGRLFLLAGEPGIGKSRLAEELIAAAEERGAQVLVGRCWEAGGAPAYWPWVQSLRAYVRDVRCRGAARAARRRRRRSSRRSSPSCASAPGPAGAARARVRGRALPPLRRDRRPSCAPPPRRGRSCSSSTTCTRPTPPRCCSCGSSRASWRRAASACSRRIGTSIRCPARRWPRCWPAVGARAGRPAGSRSRGLSEAELARVRRADGAARAAARLSSSPRCTRRPRAIRCSSARSCACSSVEGVAVARIAVPQSVRDVIARRLAHLSEACNRLLVLAVRARPRVRARRARAPGRARRRTSCSTCSTRRWPLASSPTFPARPAALRFAHVLIRDTLYEGLSDASAHAAAPAGRRRARGAVRGRPRTAPRRARPPRDRRQRRRRGAVHYAARAADRALALARLRGGRAPVRDGAGGARAPDRRGGALQLLLVARRGARRGPGHGSRAQGPRSSRRPASRGGSACAHELARAAAGYGGRIGLGARRRRRPARAAARGGARRARRRGRRAPGRAARAPRRARCATSRRGRGATS